MGKLTSIERDPVIVTQRRESRAERNGLQVTRATTLKVRVRAKMSSSEKPVFMMPVQPHPISHTQNVKRQARCSKGLHFKLHTTVQKELSTGAGRHSQPLALTCS
jgi:hypothetical protein